MMAPGASVYRHICINCHGPNADGKGLQVDLLAAASEGEARPANFRDGLFGPSGQPLANVLATFDVTHAGDMATAAQWGSRYMAWMALGGTTKRIPQDIIQLVAATRIMGVARANLSSIPGATDATGNMLNLAKGLCADVLPSPTEETFLADLRQRRTSFPPTDEYPPLQHLGTRISSPRITTKRCGCTCAVTSVHRSSASTARPTVGPRHLNAGGDVLREATIRQTSPSGITAGNSRWAFSRANLYPACLDTTFAAASRAPDMPACDADFLKNGKLLWREAWDRTESARYADNVEIWKLRGAIATGMAVFSYMRQRVTDPSRSRLPPYFDQCELLP